GEWETVDMPSTDSSSTDGSSRYFDGKRADPQPVFDDEPENLGITFNITPVADPDPDRRTITAMIDFPIKTFFDWMIFDARTTKSDGTVDGEYYKMPIFNNRNIKTNVSVYDGETVVLGGIVIDNVTNINDKIPVLGDLPVVGRLFQSKYTDSDKQNLLVFLTFRMVKPDGSALFPDSIRSKGLPVMSRSYGVQP
ncbi:MAG: hypothetical protein PHI35_04375, partial [Victivallaceae bacterium]|nr:hypothetical protein [Victivallaceae bacterium]